VQGHKKKRETNEDFRVGYLRRYLFMVLPEPPKRKCSTCLFFRSRKCSKASAGHDLVLPTDLACLEYEEFRKRAATVDMAKIIEEIAAELPEPTPYESEESLYCSVVSFLKDHVLFGNEDMYYLVASWVQATWKIVHLNEVCYLVIISPKGHGKTRLIELLYELCCKAIIASYATRAAGMRLMEAGEITFLLDEAEITLKATDPDELTALFTAGQRRGQKMIVVEEVVEESPGGKKISVRRPVARDVFGFKAVASRKDVLDTIVDRAFEIVLPKGKPKNRKIDKERAKTLRAQLRYYAEHGPVFEPAIPKRDEALMDGRMVELTETLLRATPPQYSSRVLQVALKEVKERVERIADTLEAQLLGVIKELLDKPLEAKEIERLGLIPTAKITEAYNEKYKHPDWSLTTTRAGKILATLGLQRLRHKEKDASIRGFKYDEEKLKVLYDQLFVSISPEDLEAITATGASRASTASTVERPPVPGITPETQTGLDRGSLPCAGPPGPPGPDLLDHTGKVALMEKKGKEAPKPFKCNLCGPGLGYYSSRELLQDHLAAVHGIEEQEEAKE